MAAISPHIRPLEAPKHAHEVSRSGGEAVAHGSRESASANAIAPKRDALELSSEGLARALAEANQKEAKNSVEQNSETAELELSDTERKQLRELQNRDREVRAHEQAHKAAGGDLATAPSYEYEEGPDGKQYAVAGEVGIALRPGSTPEETASIARRVRRAALAPANPSGQDLAVAASAARAEQTARAEKAEEGREETQADSTGSLTNTELRRVDAYSESSIASAASGLLDLLA